MACELDLDGVVAVFRIVVHDPEFEGQLFEERPVLEREIYAAVSGVVAERFRDQIALSRDIEVERGSIVILLTLTTVGRIIIEYGALMTGLRELARLIPERIRRAIFRRNHRPTPDVESPQIILGPTVLAAQPARRYPPSLAMTIAFSAAGGAALIVAGFLLGHFL